MRGLRFRQFRRAAVGFAATGILMLLAASAAFAQSVSIQSSGPLTDITIGDGLTCEVTANGFQQFFGGAVGATGSCGTMVVIGGQLYGFTGTPLTSTGQTQGGTGTTLDPYTDTTTTP